MAGGSSRELGGALNNNCKECVGVLLLSFSLSLLTAATCTPLLHTIESDLPSRQDDDAEKSLFPPVAAQAIVLNIGLERESHSKRA